MLKTLPLSIAAFMLAFATGCASLTPAERATQMQQEIGEMIQVFGPACEKLGYSPDTDPWRECILKLNSSKQAEFSTRQTATTHCWSHRGFFHCSTF